MNSQELRALQEAYNQVYELDEATAMAKRGKDETGIRNTIAKKTGGGESADRASALEKQSTYDPKTDQQRQNYARAQRGDFRKTTSSSPGLRGYAHQSSDPAVKAKQAARGNQRARVALTPNERTKLNMEYDLYDIILSHLLDEGYAETQEQAEVIMVNMSEDWRESIVEEFKDLTPEKENRVKNRVGELARDIQVSGARMKDLNKKPFSKFRPKVKAEKESILKSARKKHKHVANASDALVRTSISREAGIVKKMHDLRKKLEELDEN